MPTSVYPVQILLVEDNLADVEMTREMLEDSKIANDLHVVGTGDAAMAFLRREGEYAQHRRPDLVLLDLNLPGKNGREVLLEVKTDPDLRTIPVIVMTTSSSDADILAAYRAYVNCYIRKPLDLGEFVRVVQTIEDFWLSIVRLPPT